MIDEYYTRMSVCADCRLNSNPAEHVFDWNSVKIDSIKIENNFHENIR